MHRRRRSGVVGKRSAGSAVAARALCIQWITSAFDYPSPDGPLIETNAEELLLVRRQDKGRKMNGKIPAAEADAGRAERWTRAPSLRIEGCQVGAWQEKPRPFPAGGSVPHAALERRITS